MMMYGKKIRVEIDDANDLEKILDIMGIELKFPEMIDRDNVCYYPSDFEEDIEQYFEIDLSTVPESVKLNLGLWYTDQDGGNGPFYNVVTQEAEW